MNTKPKINKPKLTVAEAVIGFSVLLVVANYAAVKFGFRPYLYCYGKPLVEPIFSAWAEVLHIIVLCWLAYALIRRKGEAIAIALVIFIIIYGLPIYADAVFRLGGTCG